ncbi:MAG: glycosyltransferase family 39 protein [Deltaproteobacteria bacterium]|nr:glycosyltransferase family 39 protein [Deltaproteobacteria bacterium]
MTARDLPHRSSERSSLQGTVPILLGLGLLAMTAQTFSVSATRLQPRYDEVHYLSLPRDYQREGGLLGAVRCHLEGRCRDANRNPLFQLVLLPFTHDAPVFYADAKLVTFGTALLLALAIFLVSARRFAHAPPAGGPPAASRVGARHLAAAAVLLLCLMPSLAELAGGVLSDVLHAALVFTAVAAIARAQDRGPVAWILTGAAIGLAYLTKGNAHLLFLPLLCVGLHLHGPRLLRRPQLYLAVLAFAAVAAFLLVRNARVYGNPLHNFNDRTVWLDRWEDTWALMNSPEWNRIGLGWYLERHSVFELAGRVLKGLGETIGVFVYVCGLGVTAAQPTHLPVAAAMALPRVLTGLAVLLLAGLGMRRRYREGHRAEVLAPLYTTGWLFLAFGVGAQGVGEIGQRFMLPFAVLYLPHAAFGLLRVAGPALLRRLRIPEGAAPWFVVVAASVPLCLKLGWFASGLATNPRAHVEVPPGWARTSAWFASHLGPTERYAIPHNSLYSTWDRPFPMTDARFIYNFQGPAQPMLAHLQGAQVTKLLVDAEDRDLSRYREKLSPEADAHGALAFLGWRRCFADGARPSRFLIYCAPPREAERYSPTRLRTSRERYPPLSASRFAVISSRRIDSVICSPGSCGGLSAMAVSSRRRVK